jgi:hypothetical protein
MMERASQSEPILRDFGGHFIRRAVPWKETKKARLFRAGLLRFSRLDF